MIQSCDMGISAPQIIAVYLHIFTLRTDAEKPLLASSEQHFIDNAYVCQYILIVDGELYRGCW